MADSELSGRQAPQQSEHEQGELAALFTDCASAGADQVEGGSPGDMGNSGALEASRDDVLSKV
jgi:hypothetical protein